jgi:hypothetical protein
MQFTMSRSHVDFMVENARELCKFKPGIYVLITGYYHEFQRSMYPDEFAMFSLLLQKRPDLFATGIETI